MLFKSTDEGVTWKEISGNGLPNLTGRVSVAVAMHTNAQQQAGLMMGQSTLVMSGTGANMNRYRSMMATINSNMSGIAANVMNGMDMTSTFMTGMMSQMQTQLGAMPSTGGFSNYSGMFRNMTSHNQFWSNTGMPMSPMSGGMMN